MNRPKYLAVLAAAALAGQAAYGQSDISLKETVTGRAEVTASHSITLQPGFHAVAGSNFHAYIGAAANAGNPVAEAVTVATSAQTSTPTAGTNYIRTIAFREAQTTMPTGAFAHTEQVAYFDGLGRPSQTVAVGASPEGKDIVTPIAYDGFGREAVKYLPYATPQSNGQFVGSAVDDCIGFYSSDVPGKIARDTHPFSTTVFDNSPLNRVVSVTGPGQDWYTAGKATRYNYATNVGEIESWDENNAPFKYPASSLYVTEATDEDGNLTREYKDKLGQVVRKESVNGSETLRTAYVYDDFGLLRTVVPPKAASPADAELCYFYTYDKRKRMESKKIPGAAIVYMVYDQRDRLVLSQDGSQRAADANKYLFTKYDALNRPVMTGTAVFNKSLATIRNDFGANTTNLFETTVASTGTYGYSLNSSYPTGYAVAANDVLTVTWYDNYDFLGAMQLPTGYGYADYPIPTGFATEKSTMAKGMPTGTMAKVLSDASSGYPVADGELVTVTYYDDYGNPVRTIADNHMGGKEVVSSRFKPVTREVAETVALQKVPGQTDLVIAKGYTYDHTGRQLETTSQVNNGPKVVLGAQRYNALGELTAKYLHSPDAGAANKTFAQKVDYAYNIRGWLAKINDPADMGNDAFAMELCYQKLGGIGATAAQGGPRYNGNISAVKWNTAGDKLRGYGFTYDGLNRLTAAKYGEGTALDANLGLFDENIPGYDANGNIAQLKRYFNGALADDLSYAYELEGKSNRLKKVADHMGDAVNDPVGDLPGVSDYAARAPYDYGYDANGNMTVDPGKATTVAYNYLNLPQRVTFGNNQHIFYIYDAVGRKLAQSVENGTDSERKWTDYVGGTVYTNNQPSFSATEEGRMVPDGSVGWRYEYFLKDHLGNTRAVVAGTLIPGGADVLQTTAYYPFGLAMAQTDYNTALTNYRENRYLYNGKELQSDGFGDVELGWLDYGARFYDAAGVFWTTIDPKSEQFRRWSTYNYCMDNPLRFIDPDGMGPGDPPGGWGNLLSQSHKQAGISPAESAKILEKTGKAMLTGVKVAAIITTVVVQPEVGVPWALTDITGAPILPSPQAWATPLAATAETATETVAETGAVVEDVASKVIYNNGYRTANGKFASPSGNLPAAGSSVEKNVWKAVSEKPGWSVTEGRVYVKNASGDVRVYDGAATSPTGNTIGLEVKSGNAVKTSSQTSFDSNLNGSPSIVVTGTGKNSGLIINRALEIRTQ